MCLRLLMVIHPTHARGRNNSLAGAPCVYDDAQRQPPVIIRLSPRRQRGVFQLVERGLWAGDGCRMPFARWTLIASCVCVCACAYIVSKGRLRGDCQAILGNFVAWFREFTRRKCRLDLHVFKDEVCG